MDNRLRFAGKQFDCKEFLAELQFHHEVTEKRILETHISWVILTGQFAYKVKKPVDLGFVDYSTLEKRRHFCELEVELNRRFAPQLYINTVAISTNDDELIINDSTGDVSGEIVEYAVKMRQFPQQAIIASRLSDPALTSESVEQFGQRIADFHARIESATPQAEFAQPEQIANDADENFVVLNDAFTDSSRREQLQRLQQHSKLLAGRLQDTFRLRLEAGKTKRCHGDLHLKNIIQLDGRLIPFDGIEFNEQFQFVDVLSEIAFPVMDFMARGRKDLGWRLLNAYLETTLEYVDLEVLKFYLIYRAMVRAKVAWLNPGNHSEHRRAEYSTPGSSDDPFAGPWDKYLALAEELSFNITPRISITHGFSGSGKSTAALRVIDQEGGIRIRSDVLRNRLAGQLKSQENKYSAEMSDAVYTDLENLTRNVLQAGLPVVADASFLKLDRRKRFSETASEFGVAFEIIDCDAPYKELCKRLNCRRNDVSEANVDVLNRQVTNHDELTADERAIVRTD